MSHYALSTTTRGQVLLAHYDDDLSPVVQIEFSPEQAEELARQLTVQAADARRRGPQVPK